MASDRLTELQDQVNFLSQQFFTCVGVIQRDSPPVPLDPSSSSQSQDSIKEFDSQTRDMAVNIAVSAKTIHNLIGSLPGSSSTIDEQMARLEELEEENQKESLVLRKKVKEAEDLLEKVREALRVISKDHFTKGNPVAL
eukprot:TRINITY_DN1718_c0_g1_i1.p1 TRINITY_DN1718_c0_g1~~TRINITY_DN1718_c0_g1_i1.p1  ORF type:complete len:139 (+),score=51.18 TRINITY_DN1718_c0_g1_i1:227-643(+)